MADLNAARGNGRRSPLKAKPLRDPGQYLQKQIDEVVSDQVVPAFLVIACLWFIALHELAGELLSLPRLPAVYAITALGGTLWAILRLGGVRKSLAALKLGRDGEKVVGQFLEGLRARGAFVFHDIPAEGFNLDHVVICRQGVFVVETKTFSKPAGKAHITCSAGQLLAAGMPLDRNPVIQVRAQVKWLIRALEATTGKCLPVKGTVVFPGWYIDPRATRANPDVWLLEPKALPAFIAHEPVRLELADVKLAGWHLSRYIRSSQSSGRGG